MTIVAPGVQLGTTQLPPPPPESDPREPSPTTGRGRNARTPTRARSPANAGPQSRGVSPARPGLQNTTSSDKAVPLAQPRPQTLESGGSVFNPTGSAAPPIHHSRPSSPASIHSSASAIFERDIELPAVASLSLNPNPPAQHTLAHKSSRLSHLSHGSTLEHTVPAVLDDAVEALAGTGATSRGLAGLEIEAPAPVGGVAMARQSSSSLNPASASRKVSTGPGAGTSGGVHRASRSPSPVSTTSRTSSGVISPARSPPILSQLATQNAQAQAQAASLSPESTGSPTNLTTGSAASAAISGTPAPGVTPRPSVPHRASTGPQLPGGWVDKDTDGLAPPPTEAPAQPTSSSTLSPAQSPGLPPNLPSHLTPTKEKRRISFISYNDLLLSVPTSVTPLGDITSGTHSPEHLPGTVSPSVATRSPVISSTLPPLGKDGDVQGWDAAQASRVGGLGLGEGEWEREGLGKGLEQRLEHLVKDDSGSVSPPPLR